jgi:hypothetical protein
MAIQHQPAIVHGERVGDIISLGNRVMFFTVRRDLSSLDGMIFPDIQAVKNAVRTTSRMTVPALVTSRTNKVNNRSVCIRAS